jgi:outer membrane protein assembly complex protein YaeT
MRYGWNMAAMRRSTIAPILLALGLAAAGCKEEGTISVRRIDFVGVQALDESELHNALALRESSRLPWGRQQYFDRARLESDLKRIEAFYSDRGYPDARVTGFNVDLNKEQDEASVTITVKEGEPIRVAAVEFKEFEVLTPGRLEGVTSQVPLKVGDPRDRRNVLATHELLLNALRDEGYPSASVSTSETVPEGTRQAAVTFTASPGTLAHFGEVEIVGNKSVGEQVINRHLLYRPGDLYRRRVVRESQRRLYGMRLFQFVNIETVEAEAQGDQVRTRVTVAESKHQQMNFGIGYGTEEKARVDAEYRHVNFLGGARTAGVHGRWSSLDRGVRANVNQPYVFNPRLSLDMQGQHWYTYTPAYFSVVSGGKATLLHSTTRRMSFSVSLQSEQSTSRISDEVLNDPELLNDIRDDLIALGLDPTTGEQSGVLNAISFDFQRSTADDLLNASRGYQLALHTEQAGVFTGTYRYTAFSLDARHYIPLGEGLVIANRMQAGTLNARDDDPTKVPFSKKFFLGGATSVRGWGRFEVSPLASGLPIGGNSLFAATSELRARIVGNLGGVAFFDLGNVWEDDWTFDLNDLRYAVGLGARYRTPIGPVRFDFGYQLNPIPGLLIEGEEQTRQWRMHFSIGQAF